MKLITYQGPEPKIIPADSVLLAQEGTRCRVEEVEHTRPKEDLEIRFEGINQVVLEGKLITKDQFEKAWLDIGVGSLRDRDNLAAKLGIK